MFNSPMRLQFLHQADQRERDLVERVDDADFER